MEKHHRRETNKPNQKTRAIEVLQIQTSETPVMTKLNKRAHTIIAQTSQKRFPIKNRGFYTWATTTDIFILPAFFFPLQIHSWLWLRVTFQNRGNLAASQKGFRQQPLEIQPSKQISFSWFKLLSSFCQQKPVVYVTRPNTQNNTCQSNFRVAQFGIYGVEGCQS